MSAAITAPTTPQYAFVGVPASWQFEASGVSPLPISWAILSAAAGDVNQYQLDPATGVLTYNNSSANNSPLNVGADNLTVAAYAANNRQTPAVGGILTINVYPNQDAVVSYTGPNPLQQVAEIGAAFSIQLSSYGGVQPVAWSISDASGAQNSYAITPGGVLSSASLAVSGTDVLGLTITDAIGRPFTFYLQIPVTSLTISANAQPYLDLITSEHDQQPDFMNWVGALTGALGDITACIDSIPAAFDLDNAVGAQLDVCGQWVGQSRVVENVSIPGFFGFSEYPSNALDGDVLAFGDTSQGTAWNAEYAGVFYEQGSTYVQTTTLDDPDYLTIIKARIVRNQYDGTLSELEEALVYIFGVPCEVLDNGVYNISLVINGPVTPVQQALLSTLDILPRTAGVEIGSITYTH